MPVSMCDLLLVGQLQQLPSGGSCPKPHPTLQTSLTWWQTRSCTLFKRQTWSFGAVQLRPHYKVWGKVADAPAAPSATGIAHRKALLELCQLRTPLSVANLLLSLLMLAMLSAAHQTIVTADS